MSQQEPSHILHAGDVGALEVLSELNGLAPTIGVRGNVDPRSFGLPDVATLELVHDGATLMTILLIHVGLTRTRLRSDVRRMAMEHESQLVVCGHSHLPWIGRDGELTVLNPGAVGPRRFPLPVTFGVIETSPDSARIFHVDCETGEHWDPSNPHNSPLSSE